MLRRIVLAFLVAPATLFAQSSPASVALGAQAIGLVTRVSPAFVGRDLTEGYVTQPVLMAHARLAGGAVELRATLDGEGRTIRRGELTAGAYGEGYADRRHPHTYAHELIATLATPRPFGRAGLRASIGGGKGFAPFGTDDPMARPLVKYPVNHHLSQILERALVVGAVAAGPVLLEGGVFNGDEPESPGDAPNARRFGDSRAARLTLYARRAGGTFELQGSAARVASPEIATGGGAEQRKWSGSLRWERDDAPAAGAHETGGVHGTPGMRHDAPPARSARRVALGYALAEYALTDEGAPGAGGAFRYTSLLAEGALALRGGRGAVALRVERTLRPEEERLADPFRSVRPPTDLSILGRTRWDVVTLHATAGDFARAIGRVGVRAAPFVEVAHAHASPADRPSLFEPRLFYGSAAQWHLSAGVRAGAGMRHRRMGRYGLAER